MCYTGKLNTDGTIPEPKRSLGITCYKKVRRHVEKFRLSPDATLELKSETFFRSDQQKFLYVKGTGYSAEMDVKSSGSMLFTVERGLHSFKEVTQDMLDGILGATDVCYVECLIPYGVKYYDEDVSSGSYRKSVYVSTGLIFSGNIIAVPRLLPKVTAKVGRPKGKKDSKPRKKKV